MLSQVDCPRCGEYRKPHHVCDDLLTLEDAGVTFSKKPDTEPKSNGVIRGLISATPYALLLWAVIALFVAWPTQTGLTLGAAFAVWCFWKAWKSRY